MLRTSLLHTSLLRISLLRTSFNYCAVADEQGVAAAGSTASTATATRRRLPTWAVVFITVALTVLAMLLVYRYWFAPKPFDTVELSEREQQQLDAKLDRLMPGRVQGNAGTGAVDGAALEPQAYSEEGVSREVVFNEREVNALLARNTNLSDKLAVDLADDLVSARLLVPLDPEFPFMGGKTVRVHAGMSLSYSDGRPIAVLRGVSIMGVPVPNAWLGGLKNIDLVSEFGGGDGFWKNFADGIDQLRVENGKLSVTLAE